MHQKQWKESVEIIFIQKLLVNITNNYKETASNMLK